MNNPNTITPRKDKGKYQSNEPAQLEPTSDSPQLPPEKTTTFHEYYEDHQGKEPTPEVSCWSSEENPPIVSGKKGLHSSPSFSSNQPGPCKRKQRSSSDELLVGDLTDMIPRANAFRKKRENEKVKRWRLQKRKDEEARAENKRLRELYKSQVAVGMREEAQKTAESLEQRKLSRQLADAMEDRRPSK